MQTIPAPAPLTSGAWREQELLLMREVMRTVGRSPAPGLALRTMLHLMSELLGLNRGRMVLADPAGADPGAAAQCQHPARLRVDAQQEADRGHYRLGEGITGRVLGTGQPAIVQDIDAEPACSCSVPWRVPNCHPRRWPSLPCR
jgi:Nif-specific regulatory protein